MIRLGKEILAEQPDNLDYLYSLAMQLRFIELPNRSATPAHLSELTEYTQRTINLIEAGKVPTTIDKEKWRRNQTLSWFYQTLAMLEKADDKALELYAKSSSLDPMNAHNFLICGSIHQQRYLPAAEKFGSFQAADRDNVVTENAKPEVKAVYDEVNREADAIIDCWARFMGLTVNDTSFGETRTKISEALTDLYKYRHPDSPDGLQKLIEQYKKR